MTVAADPQLNPQKYLITDSPTHELGILSWTMVLYKKIETTH